MRRVSFLSVALCVLTVAVACSKHSSQPSAPSAVDASLVETTAGGSTLKATAPTLQSPINGVQLSANEPVQLVIGNSTTAFADVALSYRFELMDAAGAVVENVVVEGGSGDTVYTVTTSLDGEQTYQWRARAEYQGVGGPWSSHQAFVSPVSEGYVRGNELYDPLNNGKTVGTVHGDVTFIPGVGARLESDSSYIEYALPETLVAGEYSALVSGLGVVSRTEDPKWRVLTMREGYASINDNAFRMSVDKRGNGAVAWRFITGNNRAGQYLETVGRERVALPFHEDLTYLVRASWGGGTFRVQYVEGGVDGNTIYDLSKGYQREYNPFPHMVIAGSPYQPGDRGEASSVAGMVIRQIWVSANPRPGFANH
jgi:hypothetical protein